VIRAGVLAALALAAACAGGDRPRAHRVEVRGFVFEPQTLEAAPGDTLVWANHDLVPHTATDSAGAWDTGTVEAGAEGRVVAPKPGVYPYRCALHPTMRGTLRVR
jgi:plastocyanin